MKCLTLTQPWASLVARGAKKIETRTWGTSYRGPIAIHGAKGWTASDRALLETEPFRGALGGLTVETIPRGVVIAVADLVSCRLMVEGQAPSHELLKVLDVESVGEPERSFGGYASGRFAWFLENVHELAVPVEARGALSLFELPEATGNRVQALREDFEERAGILEFQGGLSRVDAERLARLFMAGPEGAKR